MRRFGKLIRDTEAATAVEYALIAALLVIVVVVGVANVSSATAALWNSVSSKVEQSN